jgi:hypothetical protein
MWLPEPLSSPAPHLDGQRALSGGGDQLGVCAKAEPLAIKHGSNDETLSDQTCALAWHRLLLEL